MADLTLAKLNTQTNAPTSSASKKKRTTIYNAGIIAGTTVFGGGLANVLDYNQSKKRAEIKLPLFIEKYFSKLIETSKSGDAASEHNKLQEFQTENIKDSAEKLQKALSEILDDTSKIKELDLNIINNLKQKYWFCLDKNYEPDAQSIEREVKRKIDTMLEQIEAKALKIKADVISASIEMQQDHFHINTRLRNHIAELDCHICKLNCQLAENAFRAKEQILKIKETFKIVRLTSLTALGMLIGAAVGGVIVGVKHSHNKKKEGK